MSEFKDDLRKQEIKEKFFGVLSGFLIYSSIFVAGLFVGGAVTQSSALHDRQVLVQSYKQTIDAKDQLIEYLLEKTIKTSDKEVIKANKERLEKEQQLRQKIESDAKKLRKLR